MIKDFVKIGVVGLVRGGDLALSTDGKKGIVHAICDVDPNRMEEMKKALFEQNKIKNPDDVLCFTDYDEFLKSDVDAVVVATKPDLHTPMAIKALEAGKHVLSEIPTVVSGEEAKLLKSVVDAHPELKYMAGENTCYCAFVDTWKKIYEDGLLGEAVFAESEYLHHEYKPMDVMDKIYRDKDGNPTWRAELNAIKYLTHNLGPLLYIMNDRCVSVNCFSPGFKYSPEVKTGESDQVAIFKTEKGAIIKIFIGFGTNVGMDHNFNIYGTKGTLETDRNESCMVAHTLARFADFPYTHDKIEIPVAWHVPDYEQPLKMGEGSHGGIDCRMMSVFVDCILNDTPSPLDVEMGIQFSLAGIYAEESAKKNNATIEIPLFK